MTEREAALARELRSVTNRLDGLEQVYHMYPSFDRPVEGCSNCEAVAEARRVLASSGQHKGEQP